MPISVEESTQRRAIKRRRDAEELYEELLNSIDRRLASVGYFEDDQFHPTEIVNEMLPRLRGAYEPLGWVVLVSNGRGPRDAFSSIFVRKPSPVKAKPPLTWWQKLLGVESC
jgi:hypothetical protein